MELLFRSSSTKFTDNYLRKRRKWPLSPYKAKWQHDFNQRQAMEILKRAAETTTTQENPSVANLLSVLVDTFSLYNCEPSPSAYQLIIKTLTSTSDFLQLHQVLNRLEKVEKFETPENIFVNLVKFYGNASRFQDAIELFFRIPKFRCVPTVYCLNSLLSILCKNKEGLSMVPQVLLRSLIMRIRIEESSLHILIATLCRLKKFDCGIQIMNHMLSDGCSLDVRLCSLILSSMCKQRGVSTSEIMSLLDEMRKLGFIPKSVDYSNLIRFLVRERRGNDALDILNQMKLGGIKPDVYSYTMVLNGLIKVKDYTKADALFDEMLVLGVVPDVYTYNVCINGLCKKSDIKAGVKMISQMEDLGCKPNLVTYNTLLEGFCKVGDLSGAEELVREMGFKGFGLSLHSYRRLIALLVTKDEVNAACDLLEEMMAKGIRAPSSTINEIICGLCQKGLTFKALKLINEFGDKRVPVGAKAWEALILGSGLKLNDGGTTFLIWSKENIHCIE